MKKNNLHLSNILNEIINNDFKHMKCNYVLEKKLANNSLQYKCMFTDSNNPDEGIEITLNDNEYSTSSIFDWSFDIDENIFSELEDGYIIRYLPLDEHYNIWYMLDEYQEEINHIEGMQIYLQYCFKNGITADVIALLGNKYIDVMQLHEEMNQGYMIIHELSIENNSTVIGYNPNAHSKYVTWSTTKNRKYGYELGHYYNNLKDALQDFESRTNILVKRSLETMKRNLMQKKDISYER